LRASTNPGSFASCRHPEGRLQVRHLEVVAQVRVDVLVVIAEGRSPNCWVKRCPHVAETPGSQWQSAAPVAEGADQLRKERVVRRDRAPLAHGDVVRGEEAERRQVAEGAGQATVVAAAQGVAVILNEPQAVLAGDALDRRQVERDCPACGRA